MLGCAVLLGPLSGVSVPGQAGAAFVGAGGAQALAAGADSAPASVDEAITSEVATLLAPSPESAPAGTAESEPVADWVDPAARTGELLVLFDDPGVPREAQGSPELAAEALQQQADSRWSSVEAALDRLERAGSVRVLNRFWVTNAVLVEAELTDATMRTLAALPGATEVVPNHTVEGLAEEGPTPREAPAVPAATTLAEGPQLTYGLEKIRAQEVWRDFGARGQGVRVAVLDTGVDATHPDIQGRLVGRDTGDPSYPGGWINFTRSGTPVVSKPSDPGSHGTHVAGTIVGGAASGTQIGVAPEAELMAANVLSGGGSTAKIFAALEWVVSPYDGTGKPAGRAADVINMSLGSGAYDRTLIKPIQNVRKAGIFPAIAIGNAPCGPNGTSSPGDIFEAFGVGMTDANDVVAAGSCGATTNWPAAVAAEHGWPANFIKPNASAPGVAVFSAMPGGLWGDSTGTSMATPHVAGAVALMRSAQAGLSVTELERALESTAWHPDGATQDSRYGFGRIDVHRAVSQVIGTSGVIGSVVDASTGAPVPGASVSFGEHGETWVTDADGIFTATLPPGSYRFSVERFGFESAVSEHIAVTTGGYEKLAIPLTPITVGSISGLVVDHATQLPISGATVALLGQPISVTTAGDGSYRFDGLPHGEYRVRVSADGMQDATSAPAQVKAALDTRVNFWLAAKSRVLVLGDSGGRTTALLADNGLVADRADGLPADVGLLASYSAVVWDTPAELSQAELTAARAAAAKAHTGMVWLDLGSSELSGIAQLQRIEANPRVREHANDRTLTSTGYSVTAPHAIFAGGALSPDPLQPGALLLQNTAQGGPKFTAWFSELAGEQVTTLAEAVGVRQDETDAQAPRVVEPLGTGIAVDEREDSRQVYLSLHATTSAADARTWSAASQQLLLNSVVWAGPAASQAPEPEITVPTEPTVTPPTPGGTGPAKPPAAVLPPAQPALTPARASATAPAAQAQPKPEHTPKLPVAAASLLTQANAGGVTAEVKDGIAHVTIPGAKPGDWFFLHVYPQRLPVGWIRVNDEGVLRIDITRLGAGEYRFAFTNADDEFVGWAAVTVAGQAASEAAAISALAPPRVANEPEAQAGFGLSTAEQVMLLGAAIVVLATAGVVLFGTRREPGTGPATGPATPAPAAGAGGASGDSNGGQL
ncbi:hypothetical protein GCM10020360_28790 [Nonlabens tegetincola]